MRQQSKAFQNADRALRTPPDPAQPPLPCHSWMAQRMAQARVIALLEPYLDHGMAAVRQKAAQHLMVATYRPPDRPTSPVRRG